MEKATKQQTEIKFWVFETQQINKDTKFEPLDDQQPTPTVSYVVFAECPTKNTRQSLFAE